MFSRLYTRIAAVLGGLLIALAIWWKLARSGKEQQRMQDAADDSEAAAASSKHTAEVLSEAERKQEEVVSEARDTADTASERITAEYQQKLQEIQNDAEAVDTATTPEEIANEWNEHFKP